MTKTELLERLETLKTEQGAKACFGCHYLNDKCQNEGCVIIREVIKKIKIPDEGERKRGYWINFFGNYSVAECSMCGERFDAEHSVCKEVRSICEAAHDDIQPMEWWHILLGKYRYCPNCGAEM